MQERAWPRIGTRIWLYSTDHPEKLILVEAAATVVRNLRITAPRVEGTRTSLPPPSDGETMLIGWGHATGYTQTEVRFVEEISEPTEVWELEAVGRFETSQRRQYVRVTHVAPAEVLFSGADNSLSAMLVDVGEGGVRFTITSNAARPEDDSLQITIDVGGYATTYRAQVAWWGDAVEGRRGVGAKFLGIGNADSDRLRAYVFGLQMQERRRERERE